MRGWKSTLGLVAAVASMVAGQVLVAPSASAGIQYLATLNATGDAELYHPWGLTTDDLGNIYVADTNHHRIVKFGPGYQPKIIFGTGSPETAGQDGHLYYPESLVWANDLIYVADTFGPDIQVFTTGGVFVTKWGKQGSAEGEFYRPNGITADCGGNIYVTDGVGRNIQKFDGDGNFIRRFGGDEVGVPSGVAVRSYRSPDHLDCSVGNVYVSDEYYGTIVKFRQDGTWAGNIGGPGQGPMQFSGPEQLVLEPTPDAGMHLWVAESGEPYRVQHLYSQTDGATWSYAGEIREGETSLGSPHGVAMDQQGNLFIANTNESQVYAYKRAAPNLLFSSDGNPRRRVKETEGLWFALKYNQLSKSCKVLVKATVTVPPNQSHVFTVEDDTVVGNEPVTLKVDLSDRQMGWLKEAWREDRNVPVHAKARASCSGDIHLSETDDFKIKA